MNSIYIPDYDPQDFVPRGVVNLIEGKGLPTAADVPRRVCLIGVRSEGEGFAPFNQPVRVFAEKPEEEGLSAVELFGSGSELHLMCRAAFRAYPGVELWGIPVEEPATGRSEAKLTVAGTAGRTGEWIVCVHGEPVEVRIEEDSDPEATLRVVADALSARDDLPLDTIIHGDVGPGTVPGTYDLKLRAKHKGENGSTIDLYRKGGVQGQSLTATPFSSVPEKTDLVPAYSALESTRFHYVAVSNTYLGALKDDSLSELRSRLDQLAQPERGKRLQVIYGSIADLETTIGSADNPANLHGTSGLNSPRMQCVWSQGSSMMPGELASAVAAHRAWMEGSFAAANTAGNVVVGVPRPRLPSNLPDHSFLNSALHSGVTPLDIKGTEMAIVRSVTTRFLQDGGGEIYNLLDTLKVTVSDYVADDITLKMLARFGQFKLALDTDAPLPARTATPGTIRKSIIEWLRGYEALGLVRGVEGSIDDVKVELSDESPGRVNFELPESVVDICAVTAGNLIRY